MMILILLIIISSYFNNNKFLHFLLLHTNFLNLNFFFSFIFCFHTVPGSVIFFIFCSLIRIFHLWYVNCNRHNSLNISLHTHANNWVTYYISQKLETLIFKFKNSFYSFSFYSKQKSVLSWKSVLMTVLCKNRIKYDDAISEKCSRWMDEISFLVG